MHENEAVVQAMAAPVVLTIAGSDSGGGAGIQADLKTCEALGVFGTTAIVALTAQNTKGVHGVHPVPIDFIKSQISAIADDFEVSCIKTGMLPTKEIISTVVECLQGWPERPPLVLDPVMMAASGDPLIDRAAIETLRTSLLPLAAVVTPNMKEAALLVGKPVSTLSDMEAAAAAILKMGPAAVLVKGCRVPVGAGAGIDADGGDLERSDEHIVDVFLSKADPNRPVRLQGRRVCTRNTHGTGCTLAAALAAEIAKQRFGEGAASDVDMTQAARRARAYLQSVLETSASLSLGAGAHGPLNHQRHVLWGRPHGAVCDAAAS